MIARHSTSKIYVYQVITLGFYFLYWCKRSGQELNSYYGHKLVPTFWWLILPFGAIWWMWQYTMALSDYSRGRIKQEDTFFLFVLITYGWEIILNIFSSFPFNILNSHLSKTGAAVGYIAFIYIVTVMGCAFFSSLVQRKLNGLACPTPLPADKTYSPKVA
ncbi:MAG TPA: hypothetical protein VFN51_01410 [Candidatus Saccharimonadales bacterium]|nr:hypothetical protein [Candidatus Saccharimonadales bacterium]